MANELIRLTEATPNQAAYLVYSTSNNLPVSSANGLSITFDFYAYGGSGADGISFFLVDGNVPIQSPGGFGGSLGYAPYITNDVVQPGIAGGYVGIGLDEFGGFSSGTEGRVGGGGRLPDSIAVRGSAANNYTYLAGASLPVSLDNPDPAATRETSKRTAKIDLDPNGILSVSVDLNQDGDFLDNGEVPISGLNLVTSGNGALPSSFNFGFAASTGGQTNIHEVGNFKVSTFTGTPLPGSFSGNLVILNPSDEPSRPSGGSSDDLIQTGNGKDVLNGNSGNDTLVGGGNADTISGGPGSDRFYFRGASRREALRNSTLNARDQITDFKFSEGDKFGLDFDNNFVTIERPRGLFNSGKESGNNLLKAAQSAYADKDFKKKGNQALKANEAVFFRLGNRTYLSVNDNKAAFSRTNDLLADVTNIQFKPGDSNKGRLGLADYFVV